LEEVLQLKEETWFSRGVALAPECNKNIVDASLDRLEQLRRTGTYHQLIASAISIRHARAIRSLYAERGYSAAEIHTRMPPDERAVVLQQLRSGLLDCLVQVQMLGEGFDHKQLSVAAVFRPYRSLSPYVQFIGRTMRVVVQNDPRHPDNSGFVVSHIGMNVDAIWEDFKELEREDSEFFQLLLAGAEPELPAEVVNGDTRQKLTPEMVVHQEVISHFFEDDFLSPDDEALVEELKKHAEALGFDADAIVEQLAAKSQRPRTVEASAGFPVLPQLERREARKRLGEEIKSAAKVLLNRAELSFSGRELSTQLFPGTVSGGNFAAAVQMFSHEVNRELGIKTGKRGTLTTEQLKIAMEQLSAILDTLTRRIMKRKQNGEEG
jgi:superfamily II DNA/RNA helicase